LPLGGRPLKETTVPAASKPKTADAVQLLSADHKTVDGLFKRYEKLCKSDGGEGEKTELAAQICALLTVHATIEEELVYPAARGAIEEQDLLDEAEVEHATAKDLIAQIEDASSDDDLYDAKVVVLGEYIRHHVKEEEGELFPKLKKAKLDLVALGAKLQARKQQLMSATEPEPSQVQ
jgi:hemerythrin superfamily protein